MVAIEQVRPGTKEPDPAATQPILASCRADALLVLPCGTYGKVLRLLPPLVCVP
jgi:4-aminobutyrate aminotransferase/(S)-3-amino-2-methylpropionate transaminase